MDDKPRVDESEGQDGERQVVGGFARTVRIAVVMLVLMLGTIAVWAWLSSGSDTNLPFGYGGFD